jgi:hypothetical protein
VAKRQTRKSLSLNREIYTAAMKAAADDGLSCSDWVTRLIRTAIPGLPETVHLSLDKREYVRPARVASAPIAVSLPLPRALPRASKPHLMTAAEVRGVLIRPGTRCANCLEKPATHRGRVDRSGRVFALCDDCELPSDGAHL